MSPGVSVLGESLDVERTRSCVSPQSADSFSGCVGEGRERGLSTFKALREAQTVVAGEGLADLM